MADSQGDPELCAQMRHDELTALQSIYAPGTFSILAPDHVRLALPITFSNEQKFRIRSLIGAQPIDEAGPSRAVLSQGSTIKPEDELRKAERLSQREPSDCAPGTNGERVRALRNMVLNASGKGKERAYESLTPALAGVRLADGEVEDKGPITQRRRGRKRRGKGNAPLNDGHINGLGGEPPDLLLGTTTGERRPGRGGPEKVQVNGNAPGRGQARGRGRGRGRANGHEGVLKSGLHPSAPVFEPVRDVSSNGQSHHVPSQKSAPGSKSISSPSITATPEIEAINPASGPSASRPEPVKLEETVLSLKHLAPLELELQLPPTYPLHAPPRVLSMHAPWLDAYQPAPLHELETLQSEACIKEWIEKRLAGLWDEMRAEILYIWGEFVSEGIWGDEDVGEFLLRAEKGAGEEGNTDVDFLLCEREEDSPRLPTLLGAYDATRRRAAFEGENFSCGICLEDRKGARCDRLGGCGHVFCHDCLVDYLSMLIREGFHRQASSCPDPSCVKSRAEASNARAAAAMGNPSASLGAELAGHPSVGGTGGVTVDQGGISPTELCGIVGQELFTRWKWLCDKARAESDPTVCYCPRPGCQAVVLKSEEAKKEDEGTMHESMRECPECSFIFCVYCKRTWHGKAECALVSFSSIVTEYTSFPPHSAERALIEARYGRANIERLVRVYEEEMANRKWMEEHATPCPTCKVNVEKSFGCNHMTCRACATHFCYRCGKTLNPREPYRHFNTPGQTCYMKLFDGLVPGGPGGDGDGDGGGGGGGGIGGAGPNGDDAGDANRQILAALVGEGLGLDDDPLNDPLNWEGVFD